MDLAPLGEGPSDPYTRHAGSYTRYGDIMDLVSGADDMFVVFGSGEEVALDFDPAGPPELETGWARDYFFYADAFAKDMDFYGAHASTVEPLPFHTGEPYPYASGPAYPLAEEYLHYLIERNARHDSGSPAPAYRYQYD